MIYNVILNDHGKVCNSCTIYIVLLIITSITLNGHWQCIYLFLLIYNKKLV